MSKYTPEAGDLFYAVCTRTFVVGGAIDAMLFGGGAAVAEKRQDRSWADAVFRAVAADDRMVVADITTGYSYLNDKRVKLQRNEFNFLPVGPEVAAALGLTNAEGA